MTIKEAFGMLHKAVKKSGMNPFFLIGNLKDTFKDVADNVVDGSNVEVESAQESGFLVGNIKVNGEDNYLYAPPQPPTPDIYDTTERLVGVFFHDGISENVYEKDYVAPNISFVNNKFVIDPNLKNVKILRLEGCVVANETANTTASLTGIPGVNEWTYAPHIDNTTGFGLFSIYQAQSIVGGTCYCSLRYVKNS